MIKRRTNIIDIDHDAYVLYLHTPSDTLMAIDISETERFHQLISDNDGIEKVPNKETVDGIRLQYNADKNAYDIQSHTAQNVRLNELAFTWIQFSK